jgi:hypothetical protein
MRQLLRGGLARLAALLVELLDILGHPRDRRPW